jgi:hypothetical protein
MTKQVGFEGPFLWVPSPFGTASLSYLLSLFFLLPFLPGNADGGLVRLTLDSPDLKGTSAKVDRFDDPVGPASDCTNSGNDCHAYSSGILPTSLLFRRLLASI